VKERDDVGRDEEEVGGVTRHLQGEAKMGPQAREGDDSSLPVPLRGKEAPGGRNVEIEPITVMAIRGQKVADEV
jgi:hypothetical protein